MLKMTDAELINRFKDMSKLEVINVLVEKMDDMAELLDKLSKVNYEYNQLWINMNKLSQKNEKASKHIAHLKLGIKFWQQIADTYKQLLEMEKL